MSGLPSLKLLVNTTKLPKITILAVRLYLMAHFDFSFSPFQLLHRSSSGFFRILSPTRMLLSQCYPYFHLSYFLLLSQECTFFLRIILFSSWELSCSYMGNIPFSQSCLAFIPYLYKSVCCLVVFSGDSPIKTNNPRLPCSQGSYLSSTHVCRKPDSR